MRARRMIDSKCCEVSGLRDRSSSSMGGHKMSKSLDYYRALPYTRSLELVTEEDGTYFLAFVKEIPWIRAFGDTRDEALAELGAIFMDGLEAMLEAGDEIPEPQVWPMTFQSTAPRVRRSRKRANEGTDARSAF